MSPGRHIKVFKGTPEKCNLGENININVASDPVVQKSFSSTVQPVSLNTVKPWSVTCPSTFESLQKLQVQNGKNSKVYFCQGDITKINFDTTGNSANEALVGGGAIHENAGLELLDQCQKLNGCETGEW